ncbi:hypothetical protein IM40_04665 [Candidatus Paracaedimonas acanthamoebae]|nr:hypothetical protein IM40_04665 [Candidatus Paracaedimonas acanthamoebae]
MPFHPEKRPSAEKSKNNFGLPFNPLSHAFGVYLPYYAPHIRKDDQSRDHKKRKRPHLNFEISWLSSLPRIFDTKIRNIS